DIRRIWGAERAVADAAPNPCAACCIPSAKVSRLRGALRGSLDYPRIETGCSFSSGIGGTPGRRAQHGLAVAAKLAVADVLPRGIRSVHSARGICSGVRGGAGAELGIIRAAAAVKTKLLGICRNHPAITIVAESLARGSHAA